MARDVSKLRDILFDELDRLSDTTLTGDKLKEEIERAQVIQSTAGRIIDTAKAQTDRMKVIGMVGDSQDQFLEGTATRKQIAQDGAT